jgi:putative hydrolase of the HAD superfamily
MPASAQVFEAALIRVVVTVDAAEAARYSTRQGMLASICGAEGRTVMQHITAIGFDLFETLIVVENLRREEAVGRLMQSLKSSGLAIADERFFPIYRATARRFMEAAQHNGQETHNRFWVSTALQELGYDVQPDDTRIALAVETYFTAFTDYAVPIPGTMDMLAALKGKYRLGLLSNLTHAPAALHIIDKLGMAPFFDAVVVSGQLGYRKPHPKVFLALLDQLGTSKEQTVFVGDNLEADIQGAQHMGMQPVWMTYVQSQKAREGRGLTAAPPPATPNVPTITNWQDFLRLLAVP